MRLTYMWRRLKNVFLSLKTYRTLSPDLRMRWRVNKKLRQRPALSLTEWYETFWQPLSVSRTVVNFAYTHLKLYSGLAIARITPSDQLDDDLHWVEVCWFDWETTLCEDVWQVFHVDISDRLLEHDFCTLADLMIGLNHAILTEQAFQHSSSPKSVNP
ncbi:MAG TPA: hypothetical protein V6C78_20525 [Crinalium sp.]